MTEEDIAISFNVKPNLKNSLKNELQGKLSTSEEVCPIHHIKLISAFGKPPICFECGREAIEQRTQELADKAIDNQLRNKTYRYLQRDSIFLDKSLAKASFENYKTGDGETEDNKNKALEIAREYYKGADYNTIFIGSPGTGKSHLSMSMLKVVNDFSKPYRRCLFVSIDEVMRKIRGSFNNSDSKYTEQYVVDLLTEVDLLVIDDLGAEVGAVGTDKQASDFVSKILYSVINGRMNKPTIITTNLTNQELAKMYDSKLVSRMFRGSQGHVIKFTEKTKDKRINFDF